MIYPPFLYKFINRFLHFRNHLVFVCSQYFSCHSSATFHPERHRLPAKRVNSGSLQILCSTLNCDGSRASRYMPHVWIDDGAPVKSYYSISPRTNATSTGRLPTFLSSANAKFVLQKGILTWHLYVLVAFHAECSIQLIFANPATFRM